MGIAFFTCDSFHSSDTWNFFHDEKPTWECRKSFDIFVSRISQPRVNYPSFSYSIKILKQLKIPIIIIYYESLGRQQWK